MSVELLTILIGIPLCFLVVFRKELIKSFWQWRLRTNKRQVNKIIKKLEGYE